MRKFFKGFWAMVVLSLATVAPAMAETAAATGDKPNSLIIASIFLGAAIAAGLGAIGPGVGQGSAVRGACEGMARNPGMYGKLMTTMFLGLAIMEALTIYALVIAFMLLFMYLPDFM